MTSKKKDDQNIIMTSFKYIIIGLILSLMYLEIKTVQQEIERLKEQLKNQASFSLSLVLPKIDNPEERKVVEEAIAKMKAGEIELSLSGNQIGHMGATALAAALPSSKLVELWLSGNQIGDQVKAQLRGKKNINGKEIDIYF